MLREQLRCSSACRSPSLMAPSFFFTIGLVEGASSSFAPISNSAYGLSSSSWAATFARLTGGADVDRPSTCRLVRGDERCPGEWLSGGRGATAVLKGVSTLANSSAGGAASMRAG